MSDIDDMLKAEEGNTPTAPQAGNKTQSGDEGNPIEGATQQLNEEEVRWNSLKGPTQDRFRAVLRDLKSKEAELERLHQIPVPPAPPLNTNPNDPNVKQALNKLREYGIVMKEDLQEALGQKDWQDEVKRLESKYDGNDGKPRFTRDEYFDYINRHPEYRTYLPEDVYEKMYREELSDIRVAQPQNTRTLKPTKSTNLEEPWTPEKLEETLKGMSPDQRIAWIDKNKAIVDKVTGSMQ